MAGGTAERPLMPVGRLALGWGAKLWLGVVALLAVTLAATDVQITWDRVDLYRRGARAQGTVLGWVGGDEEQPLMLRYRFVAQEGPQKGQEFVSEQSVSAEPREALQEGMAVEVIYLPRRPELSVLALRPGQPLDGLGWLAVWQLPLLGALLMPLLGVLWRMAQLRWRGVTVCGAVAARWRTRCRSCVAYRFDVRSPDGQVHHLGKVEIDRWAYRHLQVGDAGTMRYLPENPAVSRDGYRRRRTRTGQRQPATTTEEDHG
jgi:hypothetical protein